MRILLVEDEPLIALDLEFFLVSQGHTVIGPCASIHKARQHLDDPIDFALLDIDLADGKSFDIAVALGERRTPFAFLSASRESDLPPHLRGAPFLAKPYQKATVLASLRMGMQAAA